MFILNLHALKEESEKKVASKKLKVKQSFQQSHSTGRRIGIWASKAARTFGAKIPGRKGMAEKTDNIWGAFFLKILIFQSFMGWETEISTVKTKGLKT